MTPRLYSYWRSSAAYRVRIALNLKNIPHEIVPVSLVANGGEHRQDAYRRRNPQMLVPFYEDGVVATGQSLAIFEYLEEAHPAPALMPARLEARTFVRAFCNLIACDIHPLNNLRVMQYLERELEVTETARQDWYRHWMRVGFDAAESLANRQADRGDYVCGDTPTYADACLVPQFYNARRFALDTAAWPRLQHIDARCRALDAFIAAAPENQADAA